jgi:hypothetical protein
MGGRKAATGDVTMATRRGRFLSKVCFAANRESLMVAAVT